MVKKSDKKQIVIPTTEIEQIKSIVNTALIRIISGKTKKTYQQELHLISQTIQKYIGKSYITKEDHQKEMLTQVFGYINCFTDLKNSIKGKSDKEKGSREAFNKVISEFESLIYEKK